jgi:hypothetical protein
VTEFNLPVRAAIFQGVSSAGAVSKQNNRLIPEYDAHRLGFHLSAASDSIPVIRINTQLTDIPVLGECVRRKHELSNLYDSEN